MLSQKEFLKLKLEQRYQILRDEGTFIASRFFESFNVHLFSFNGYYVEMYQRLSLNDVVYIEILKNDSILKEYAMNVDLKKDLGLDI